MKIIVLDTETTGISKQDQVIQLAYIPVIFESFFESTEKLFNLSSSSGVDRRYRPTVPIHPEAQKVNGVQYKDLLGCPVSTSLHYTDIADADYIIGHNISYDKRMILQCLGFEEQSVLDDVKFICTLNLAKKLDKNLGIGFKNHKLDTLIDHFCEDKVKEKLLGTKHDALEDVIKTIIVLGKLLEYIPAIDSIQNLYTFQNQLKAVKK